MSDAAGLPKTRGMLKDGEEFPLGYGDIFERHEKPPRVLIGADRGHAELLLALSESWEGPFFLLYVLVTAIGEAEEGRYQSPPLDRTDAAGFVRRFARFLSEDARHEFWLAAPGIGCQVIWDKHDRLWLYGDADAAVAALDARGFRSGALALPNPHVHHYHREFAADARALHAAMEWTKSPLCPGDGG